MKIALFDFKYPRPDAVFAKAKLSSFLAAGHTVDVFSYLPERHGDHSFEAPALTMYQLPEVTKLTLARSIPVSLCINPVGTVFTLRLAASRNPQESLAQIGSAIIGASSFRHALAEPPDVIFVEWAVLAKRLILPRHLQRVPMVVALKGVSLYPNTTLRHGANISDRQLAGTFKPLHDRVSAYAAVTPFLAERAAQLGFPREKVHVIQEGVDVDIFNFSLHERDRKRAFRLITAGRLSEIKGIDLAIRAISLLTDINLEYTIVGSGPEEQRLRRLTDDLGVSEIIRFKAPMTWPELAEQYKREDAFLFTGRTLDTGQVEAGAAAAREAAASGLPLISTAVGGAAENVSDGITGKLVRNEDPKSIAEAIRYIHTQSDSSFSAMSRAAGVRTAELFSREIWDRELLRLLSSVQRSSD